MARRATSLGPKPSLYLMYEENSVQLKPFRSKICSPRGDQILLLSASTFVYSGFGAGNPVHKECGRLLFLVLLKGNPTCDASARVLRFGRLPFKRSVFLRFFFFFSHFLAHRPNERPPKKQEQQQTTNNNINKNNKSTTTNPQHS